MRTYDVFINNTDERVAVALETADDFIEQNGLEPPKSLHLRLLVEETLGMVRAMTGDFSAVFWLEEENTQYKIRLTAETEMDREKKLNLISASKTGKNAAVKGVMGKIREVIENGRLNVEEAMNLQDDFSGGSVNYGFMGFGDSIGSVANGEMVYWSLQNYRNALDKGTANTVRSEAYDELEKSVVAKLATDVVVGIKSDKIDMTITLAK